MRPVEKGEAPRHYSKYGNARQDLKETIGPYCNYCEMRLDNVAQVEHVQPKSKVPELALSWSNFLLACGYCNSTKSNKDIDLETDIFPDIDNPLMSIKTNGVSLEVRRDAPDEHQEMGRKFLSLVGRDRNPLNDSEDRWSARFDAYESIKEALDIFSRHSNNEGIREAIVLAALGHGHFSMWLSAFEDDVDMKLRLISRFKGTAIDCFDASGVPIKRQGVLSKM